MLAVLGVVCWLQPRVPLYAYNAWLTMRLGGDAAAPPFVAMEPWLDAAFTARWRDIRDEMQRALSTVGTEAVPAFHEVDNGQRLISGGDRRWKTLVLLGYGKEVPANARLCPLTWSLVQAHRDRITSAMFSIIQPGKRIPPHRGPFRGVLRYHLGLTVPGGAAGDERCWMRVDRRRYRWREGEAVLFDDTYEHEVHNDTNETRVILFLDVLRRTGDARVDAANRRMHDWVSRSRRVQQSAQRAEIQRDAD